MRIALLALLPFCVASTTLASGQLFNGPAAGDISLHDRQGHWLGVQGIPANHEKYTAKSIIVAVIDSGIDGEHPQIKGLVWKHKDFSGEGLGDKIGHGTMVSILLRAPAAGKDIPAMKIIDAKVAQNDGSIEKKAVISAINWSVRQKAQIINLSLGFLAGSDEFSDLCDAISRAKNTLFVVASGNTEDEQQRFYPASCNAQNVLSVGATDSPSAPADVVVKSGISWGPVDQ